MARYDKELTDQKDKTLVWIYVAIAVFSLLFTLGLFLLFSGEAVIFKIDGKYQSHQSIVVTHTFHYNIVCNEERTV